jgi:hypothetical protein
VASYESDSRLSIDLYQKAYRIFSEAGRKSECANALMNLAQKYVDTNRSRSARRAIASAQRLAAAVEHHGVLARARILLGEIAVLDGRHADATAHWHGAVSIAKRVNDRILHFKAECKLYQQAVQLGNDEVAASLDRRLRKLSPWIPPHIEELQWFRKEVGTDTAEPRKRVSATQRRTLIRRNPDNPHLLM